MSFNKENKQKLMQDFKINTQDTGSGYVQVALLTERIQTLTEHAKKNKKDFSSKTGMLKMISQRNSILKYLKRKDEEKYQQLIKRLKLKG